MIPVYCFKKSDLKFVDMQQITTKLNMPLFIDKNNNVIIGNSMKDLFNDGDYIQCCVINDCSQFYKDAIIDFEKAVALENDKNRLHFISHEFIDYISKENEKMSNVFATMLGTNWRIVIASIVAFWLGNYINTFIMYIMKVKSKDNNKNVSFIFRAILSTILGQIVDNSLFYIIAFAPLGIPGTYELSWLSILQNVSITTGIETISEAIFSPLTALFVSYLKKLQNNERN